MRPSIFAIGAILPLLFLSGLLLSAARPAAMVLTLIEIEQLANDHVGDEWTHTVQVDGWELKENDSIDLASAEAYDIECTSWEDDPYYPDSGSRTRRITEREMMEAAAEGGFTIDVTVREEHGEFAGHTAVWRFHFALR